MVQRHYRKLLLLEVIPAVIGTRVNQNSASPMPPRGPIAETRNQMNGWDIVLLKGAGQIHNKSGPGMGGYKNLGYDSHGSSKVIRCRRISRPGSDTVKPTSCLHSLVAEGSLQEQGTPHHR